MIFQIEGKIQLGSAERAFKKTVKAKTENEARKKVIALFGSLNGVKRTAVRIDKLERIEG
ncbi:MAG: 50S ribosomal protein L18Ae [Candidatus Bilamarchaeaceae archaeon]